MKLAEALTGVQRLCIETAPIIYFVEAHPNYVDRMRAIFKMLDSNAFEGVTSTVTLTEVLTKPIQAGDLALELMYSELLLSTRIHIEPITIVIAQIAAALRAKYNLRTPDALQLATADYCNCQAFLTTDHRLSRVTELRVIMLDDLEVVAS